ncbi:MAG: hypothetical protein MJ252_11250 [archaeon]|nr:hypothetical protein [archaeon]
MNMENNQIFNNENTKEEPNNANANEIPNEIPGSPRRNQLNINDRNENIFGNSQRNVTPYRNPAIRE